MDNINISRLWLHGPMVRSGKRNGRPSYGSRLGLGSPSRARRHTITSLTTRPCLSEGGQGVTI